MPTFLKEFCNALKLAMYSCSSLVANLTRFSTRHPRDGEREREREREEEREREIEETNSRRQREREQAGRKGRVIGANGGNYHKISVVTWKQQIHELAVNSSCVCIAHTSLSKPNNVHTFKMSSIGALCAVNCAGRTHFIKCCFHLLSSYSLLLPSLLFRLPTSLSFLSTFSSPLSLSP